MSVAVTGTTEVKSGAFPAILWGGLIAGGLDLTYAIVFYGLRGVKPISIPQSIASGLLGMRAFKGGLATAALGVACHFLVAFVAAAVYYVASRKLRFLTEEPVIWGVLYGAAIYLFMNYVVLPLSAAPKFRHTTFSIATDVMVHLFFIGLPIALAVRRYSS
jgi:uncharacterized membrane protein YagU involved in acid resistance